MVDRLRRIGWLRLITFLALALGLLTVRADVLSQVAPLKLEAGDTQRSLKGHWAVLLDPGGRLSFDQVRALPPTSFELLPSDFSAGYVPAAAWLRFELSRDSAAPEEWWLRVGPAFLDRIELFSPDGAGGYRASSNDLREPWASRPVAERLATFVLQVTAGESEVHFLRVTNATGLSAHATLWQPNAMLGHTAIEHLLIGGYLISALVLILINLAYWIHQRSSLLSANIAYILSAAAYVVQLEGFQLLILQPSGALPVKPLMALSQIALVWFMYRIFATMVEPERVWPRAARLWRGLNQSAALIGAGLFVAGQFKLGTPFLWVWMVVGFAVHAGVASLLALRGMRWARYFLASFAVVILTTFARLLISFGVLDSYDFLVTHGVMFGTLLHWMSIQLIILVQLQQSKREHESARDAALGIERLNAEELERQVRSRTAELEAAREQLRQSLDHERKTTLEQRQFLRMVAHEFRTPLATLHAGGTLLDAEQNASPEIRERALARMRNAMRRIGELVEGALALDRFESAAWRANIRSVDLGRLIQDVAEVTRGEDGNQHPIVLDCQAVDPDLFRIALHNLLDNACKFSPTGLPIEVSARVEDSAVVIRVQDQGPGIARTDQTFIFGKYARGHHEQPGLGLGLYLVDSIVRLHGGSVRVVSDKGRGASFELRMPLAS